MEICVRSAYDYLVCESRFDTKELLQAIKKDLDINFGSTYGFSSKKGEWEKVIVTEAEIIRFLKNREEEKGKTLYCYLGDGNWEDWSLADFISETLIDLIDENEKTVDRGQKYSEKITISRG